MKIKIYQVDAFAEKIFTGNPAAICPLGNDWLDEKTMQSIANENNLSETAFYIIRNNEYHIRWFTPKREVDLCGHATLAAAYIIFEIEEKGRTEEINFKSKSGILKVQKREDFITLNFPGDNIEKIEGFPKLEKCFNLKPREIYKGNSDFMLVYEKEDEINNIIVELEDLKKIEARGVIITAKGNEVDFVSRFFAPGYGVNEDPVTGSAHTTLTKYWSKRLRKTELTARQLSERKGNLICSDKDERVEISGKCFLYLEGYIKIN